jgi:hypothetical protein
MLNNPNLDMANELISKLADEVSVGNLTKLEINTKLQDFLLEQGTFVVGTLKQARVFNYTAPVAGSDPNCSTNFVPTFHHEDWIDGESVVQAEQTTFEDGFNIRFHQIESDIETLGADLVRSFLCIETLRTAVHTSLNELRTEINKINKEVFDCCSDNKSGGGTFNPGLNIPGLVQPGLNIPGLVHPGPNIPGLVQPGLNIPGLVHPGVSGLVAVERERILRPAEIAKWLEANQIVNEFIQGAGGQVSKAQIEEKFGDVLLNEMTGLTVKSAMAALPRDRVINSSQDLVDALVEVESNAVRGSREFTGLMNAFGVTEGQAVGEVNINRLDTVSANVGAALESAGIPTVGALSEMSTDNLVTTLNNANVSIGAREASAIITNARLVKRLGG